MLTLPGRPSMDYIGLTPPKWDDSVRVTAPGGPYRGDMARGVLVEDDTIGGVFRKVSEDDGEEILCDDRRIDLIEKGASDPQRLTGLSVSPGGQCLLWGTETMSGTYSELKFYDAREGKIRVATVAWDGAWALWVDPEDVTAPARRSALPPGWSSLWVPEIPGEPQAKSSIPGSDIRVPPSPTPI